MNSQAMTSRIALSIGNTRISYGVFQTGSWTELTPFLDKMDDVISDLVSQATRANVQKIAFTSVVPTGQKVTFIERAGQRNFELFEVNGKSQTLLTGLYAGLDFTNR